MTNEELTHARCLALASGALALISQHVTATNEFESKRLGVMRILRAYRDDLEAALEPMVRP